MKTLGLHLSYLCLVTAAGVAFQILPACPLAAGENYELPVPRDSHPPTTNWRQAVFQDLKDGHLEQVDLLTAAIVIGGTETNEEIHRLRTVYQQELRAIRKQAASDTLPVADVFQEMHQRFLTGHYDASCSQLTTTLTAGHYNCVTATILFQCLCRDFGVDTTPIGVPGHVHSRVINKHSFDIETTYPQWFDLDTNTERATSSDPAARTLNDVQLLAKIYYNDGVRLLQQGDHDAALHPLRQALKLDRSDQAARQNVLAALINGALERVEHADYAGAAARLQQAERVAPEFEHLRKNELHVYQQWAIALCDQGRYSDALRIFESQHEQHPEEEIFDQGRFVVAKLWAQNHLMRGDLDVAFGVFTECRTRFGNPPEFEAYEVAILRDTIESLEAARKLSLARTLGDRAIALHPHDAALQALQQRLAPLTVPP